MMNMFDLTDNITTGFEVMILQSEEYADQIIHLFKSNFENGDDPKKLLQTIAMKLNIGPEDLLPESKKRIENEVRNYLLRY